MQDDILLDIIFIVKWDEDVAGLEQVLQLHCVLLASCQEYS